MTEPRHLTLIRTAIRASFVGAVMAGSALGVAAQAGADDNCDPLMLAMTPQPVLACEPDAAPPPPDLPPAVAPVNDVVGPLPAEVPPAPDMPDAPAPLWPLDASGA